METRFAFLILSSIIMTLVFRSFSGSSSNARVASGFRQEAGENTCLNYNGQPLSLELDRISEYSWRNLGGTRFFQQSYLLRNNGKSLDLIWPCICWTTFGNLGSSTARVINDLFIGIASCLLISYHLSISKISSPGTVDICNIEVYIPVSHHTNIESNYSLALFRASPRGNDYAGVFPEYVSRLSVGDRLSFGYVLSGSGSSHMDRVMGVCITSAQTCAKETGTKILIK